MFFDRFLRLLIATLALLSATVCADEIEYVVSGIDEPMLANVINHVSAYRLGSGARLNTRLRRKLLADAEEAAHKAMRPYGFFNPVIDVTFSMKETGKWFLNVDVESGPPVLVTELQLEMTGPGSELGLLDDRYRTFPLTEGVVLNQQAWDTAKLQALDLLEAAGYLQANFKRHTMEVDPIANSARLDPAGYRNRF